MCWEKFNEYFEVEGRYVPVEVDYPVMSADRIEQYADENTIGEYQKAFHATLAVPPLVCNAWDGFMSLLMRNCSTMLS